MTTATHLAQIAVDLQSVLSEGLDGLNDSELLAGQAALEQVGRLIDAARVRYAGEVGARSRPELGDDGLSRSQNFTSPAKFVSAVTGASVRESAARLALGLRLRGAEQLGGGTGSAPFPAVSEALGRGVLAVEAAVVITKQCAALADRGLEVHVVSGAEQTLVHETIKGALSPDETAKLAVRLRELLDPDGAEPRDDLHQRERSLTYTQSSDGMIRGRFALTPDQGGVWLSSIESLQSPRTSGPRFVGEDEFVAEMVAADTRTQAQKNVDTVTELIARAAGAPEMPHLSGASTTVNVHMTLVDFEAGRGVGWIDGIDEPVPASTIEQLRCHSPLVVTLFGDRGEVLYHGKNRRLFSPAQNRALAARDGGCVWLGCERPPAWCESHHISEWGSIADAAGRTDIDNAALLCHFHHAHVHKGGWALIMIEGVPHLVPPRWRDPEQTPIRAGRRRTSLSAADPSAADPSASGSPVAGQSAAGSPVAGVSVAGQSASGSPVAGVSGAGQSIAGLPAAGETASWAAPWRALPVAGTRSGSMDCGDGTGCSAGDSARVGGEFG